MRKAGKAHGLQQRIEGPSVAGRRVLVVEDEMVLRMRAVDIVEDAGFTPIDAISASTDSRKKRFQLMLSSQRA